MPIRIKIPISRNYKNVEMPINRKYVKSSINNIVTYLNRNPDYINGLRNTLRVS